MSVNLEKIKNKIRALLAMTSQNGCTESEANNALALARKLMDEYNIESISENSFDFANITGEIYDTGKFKADFRRFLVCPIASLCSCKVFSSNDGVTLQYKFIGYENDIKMAIFLTERLTASINTEADSHVKHVFKNKPASQRGEKKVFRNSFVRGMVVRLLERINDMITYTKLNQPKEYALIVVKTDAVDKVYEKISRELNLRLHKQYHKVKFDENASNAGKLAGDSAIIHDSTANKPQVLMIGNNT